MNADKAKPGLVPHLRASAFICGCILLIGCAPRKTDVTRKPPYFGDTLPMAEVVNAINANNRKIPTLRADISEFEGSFIDDRGKRHDVSLGGTLLYRSPREVSLRAIHPVGGEVLQLGSNADLYWLITKEPEPTAWWGRYKYLGSPCAQPIPVRPDLVLEVLGVSTINTDLSALPAPVMRFNPDEDAYMFVWVTKLPDRWAATKEVWYDRQTKRPTRVILFDENGRVVLRALLANHIPVEVPGVSKDQCPMVAGEYRLYFPENGSKLRLKLRDAKLSYNKTPNDSTFDFVPKRLKSKVIQLDEACGP